MIISRSRAVIWFFALAALPHLTFTPRRPVATLRFLTHNVYGLYKEDCIQRMRFLGNSIANTKPSYDIIGFQEFYDSPGDWTCEPHHLNNAIWSTGLYKNDNNYHRYCPEVGASILGVDAGIDGGVGVFTLHTIRDSDNWQWSNDNQGRAEAKEGFLFARIRINRQLTVDTYIVHLNSGGDRDRRKKQLEQLAATIKLKSSGSGNPVIVMGDFNIGGPPTNRGNPGYEDIMQILKNPRDIWLAAHPQDPGFTYDCNNNPIARTASSNCDYQERIDYIFVVTDREFTDTRYRFSPPTNVNVVQWKTSRPRPDDSNVRDHRSLFVSDHFGLEATMEVYKIKVVDRRRGRGTVRDHRTRQQ